MPCQAKWNYIGWLEPIINNHWFGLPINSTGFHGLSKGENSWVIAVARQALQHFFATFSLECQLLGNHHPGVPHFESKDLAPFSVGRLHPRMDSWITSLRKQTSWIPSIHKKKARKKKKKKTSHSFPPNYSTYTTYSRVEMRKITVPIPSRGFWEVHMSTTSVRGTQASPHGPLVFLLMIEQSLHFEARFSLTRECLTWWGRNCQKLCPRALMEPHLNNAW